MNDMVVRETQSMALSLTAQDIRAQVNLIQEVVKAVMIGPSKENKAGVHYGVIPGTPKPTLYKPGAEVLCATFRIDPEFEVEDLSTPDCFRYRVTCRGVHQITGRTLASGLGSASSNEDKYKWRAQICNEEFDETPENRRRVKWKRGKDNNTYKVRQVRAEHDDIDNTVLKMACKRAQIAMTLNATACSDMFTQDIEDLPPELRQQESDGGEQQSGGEQQKPTAYPQDEFDKNFQKWKDTVESGRKTGDELISMIETKGRLFTDDQKKKLRELKSKVIEGEPEVDKAKLMALFAATKDADVLDAHATLIAGIADEEDRRDLTAAYKSRRIEITGNA